MIVKRFECTSIHNKALYKSTIHSNSNLHKPKTLDIELESVIHHFCESETNL